MTAQDLVSIIVPVYKVEPYLQRSLNSALAQTHENIEVIIVDDGSPDNCPVICDEYAARDSRVRVIHQENGGLSAARNAGIDAAHGGWLYFIDSDDWCETPIVEHCVEKALQHNADLVVFDHSSEGHGSIYDGIIAVGLSEGIHTSYDALTALYNESIDFGIWHFLFARKLFDHVRFPVGEICEDIAVLHELIGSANSVYVLHEIGYHYISRAGSITSTMWWRAFGWEAYQTTHMIDYARKYHPELDFPAEKRAALKTMQYAKEAFSRNLQADLAMSRKLIVEHKLRPAGLTRKGKIGWNLLVVSPKLFTMIMKVQGKLRKMRMRKDENN